MSAWALSRTPNPAVLRLDTSIELTEATIETCPPSRPPRPLDRLLEVSGIRSIDLHRYRARLNLVAGAGVDALARRVSEILSEAWGPASATHAEPARAFPVPYTGVRLVAESMAMAGSQPLLRALFGVPGVAEAILEPGHMRVSLGRLFSWADTEPAVTIALAGAA